MAYTYGPDAFELFREMGVTLFEWERLVLDDWMARDDADMPSCVTAGLSVPRQNGKNLILEAFEFFCLTVCGWHILHTAHRVKTAKKSFNRLVKYFTNKRHPEVMDMVSNIRYTNGEEAIYLKGGACIEFSARSRANTRGFDDIQLVVFDEAQDLTDDQLNAIMYTLAASATGDRMMLYTGTPPDPGSPGTVFARVRRTALDSPGKRTLWHEWGITDLPPRESTFTDLLDAIYETNPSMGLTLDEEFTETEFGNADLDGFARERLGWWSPLGGTEHVVSEEDWDACRTVAPPRDGTMSIGVKFSPDGSSYALAVCMKPDSGAPHVEIARSGSMRAGVSEIARWLLDRKSEIASVAIDGKTGVSPLVTKLVDGRFPKRAVQTPGGSGLASAVAMLRNAVNERKVTHFGQPALDSAVTKCAKRVIGSDGIGFESTDKGDATLAEAVALAYQEAMTTKRRPGRGCMML